MSLTVIVVGVALLVWLATVIGVANGRDRGARQRAWDRIADERRRNWEQGQLNRELRGSLEWCRDCPFRVPGPGDAREP